MPKQYARVTFHGKATDYRTAVMARQVEKKLGIQFICWQGSYADGSLSAGTHEGGGALDLNTPGDPDQITRHLRRAGFAAWYRGPDSGFAPHIHAIDIGNTRLSPEARSQVLKYRNGQDGLAGANPDPQPYRPEGDQFYPYVTKAGFNFADWNAALKLRQRLSGLNDRIKELLRRRRQAKRQLARLS